MTGGEIAKAGGKEGKAEEIGMRISPKIPIALYRKLKFISTASKTPMGVVAAAALRSYVEKRTRRKAG